jgi:hypothetical protein
VDDPKDGQNDQSFMKGGIMDLTTFAVSTADVMTVASAVLTGLAAIWGVRKVIKTINRS